MTHRSSEIRDLLAAFVNAETRRMEAVRVDDSTRANRYQRKSWAASEALRETAEGREAIERLLAHPLDFIRAKAAGVMMWWAPERAIPILGRFLDADLSHIPSSAERLDIRWGAQDWLYGFFEIKPVDRNDLIEPLKTYGVELSFRDETRWQ